MLFCFLKNLLRLYIYIILQKGSKDLFNLIMLVYFSFQCIFVNSIEMLFFYLGFLQFYNFRKKKLYYNFCHLRFEFVFLHYPKVVCDTAICELIHIEVIY